MITMRLPTFSALARAAWELIACTAATMVIVALATACALILSGCGGGILGDGTANIIYRVSGSACQGDATWSTANDGTSQAGPFSLPWQTSAREFEAGSFVYISAQNQCDYGTITVTIIKNGKTWKTNSSTGAYAIATASGSLE